MRDLQGEGELVWGFVFVLLIIYIEEVLLGFLSLEGFPGQIYVYHVIVFLSMILYMLLL